MKKEQKFIAGNFYYLFHELYLYNKGSIFLPLFGSISKVLLSLITIWIPKIVLDLISNKVAYKEMFCWIMVSFGTLLLISVIDSTIHNEITSCSQSFLYTCLIRKWQEKMMDMDYEVLTSPLGKIKAEKARNSVSSPNWGVVTYMGQITELLENLSGFLAYSTIICVLHPFILLLLIILFGVEMWCGTKIENKKQSLKEEQASVNRKLNYIAYKTRGIQEAKDIRIYCMVPWLRGIAQKTIKNKDVIEETSSRWELQKMLLNGFLIFLRNGFAYLFLLYQYFQAGMSIGDFVFYFTAVTGLGSWLNKLAHTYTAFIEANNFVTDFRQFMMLEIKETKGKQLYLEKPISFVWENVSFSYYITEEHGKQKEIPVLKNISLHIKAGEKLAIVGINGAGKTTFVKLMCGLLKPKSGKILVNGYDIADFRTEDYSRLFSAIFQKSGVLPVSIRDNIALNICETVEENKLWKCIQLANLEQKIRTLPEGLDTCLIKRISEQGTELSGGELQRLLLARALYKDAPVLILDEPTAALDPIAENEIYQKYNQFTEGKTAIFISHRLASTRFCDRILVMEQGGIVEMGTHEELMKKGGSYAKMFDAQSRYYKGGQLS